MTSALYAAGVGSLPLYDPRLVRADRLRFARDAVPELARANSFACPAGRWPARGWLLLKRSDYVKLNPYSTALQLTVDDLVNPPLTFLNLTVVQARCVTEGLTSAPNAVYLVEVTDARGVLWNPWAQFPTISQYNVRAPAYPEQFYTSSLNAGLPWTWDQLLGDLWGQMGAFLGPYPHLPFAPAGPPENYIFPGVFCWGALNRIIDDLGCTISVDLTKANPFGVVQVGAADASYRAIAAKYGNVLEDDMEYIDAGSGRIPGKVIVYFHRRNQWYGTEETVRMDSLQWSSTPLYAVSVNGPAPFSAAAGTGFLWDDFTVRYDEDGVPLVADVITANSIAQERATQYYTRMYRSTVGFMRRVYAGALPFVTGSQVDGVCWRQDFRDKQRAGWRTEIIRGYVWDDIQFHEAL